MKSETMKIEQLAPWAAVRSDFMKTILALACLGALLVAGCSQSDTPSSKSSKGAVQEKPLLIGLVPEQRMLEQMQRYEPLAYYLSKKLGTEVKFTSLPRYGSIIDNFVSAKLDAGFFGSFTYVLTNARVGVEVLARPENEKRLSTYNGLIFVRKDSGIRTVGDMRGKRLVLVDKATTAGYLWPLVYFRRAGVEDYRTYFSESKFSLTHEGAILDVLNGKADVGAAKNTVFDRLAADDRRVRDELVILDKSPDLPENGLAVRKGLSPEVRDRLKKALLTMTDDQEGRDALTKLGAVRFIQTADQDYEPVIRLAREARLNLATYNYLNE